MTINNDKSGGSREWSYWYWIEDGTRRDTQARVPCILWIKFDNTTVGKGKRANSNLRTVVFIWFNHSDYLYRIL